jgi:HKD family nuclease
MKIAAVGQDIINSINFTDSIFYSTEYNIKYHKKAQNSFIILH